MKLEYAYQGPKRGVEKVGDRAVLLAHGAGADMHVATLTAFTNALRRSGIPSLRFQYPYRSAGKKVPDRPPVLLEATRRAVDELARRTKLPVDRLVIGGRSMGGRYCSMVAADPDDPVPCLGLVLLGYPLHAMGKPEKERSEHFSNLTMPVLFVSGTRDSLASKPALTQAARNVNGPRAFHWIESADHGFKPLKSSGFTMETALDAAAVTVNRWVLDLPG